MANYYHEARAQVRNLKKSEESNRRRAERRAELATAREDLPVHRLEIDGRACKVHRDTQEYDNVEQLKIMVPWNGDHGCLIDRFDARAMLDFYQDPSGQRVQRSDEEKDIEERVAFESFRDLVKLVRKGLDDAAGLAYAEDEALDIRVAARSRASVAAGINFSSSTTETNAASCALQWNEAHEAEEEEQDAAEDEMIDAVGEEAGAQALDKVAAEYGIPNFAVQLQRAIVQEDEAAEEVVFRKPKRLSRRKMAERVRRMLGQGLNPFGRSLAWWRETTRAAPRRRERLSPEYGGGDAGSRSRLRAGRSEHACDHGRVQYISEFTDTAPAGSSSDEDTGATATNTTREDNFVLEAMPGCVDPAATGGPVALPAAGAVMRGFTRYTPRDREAEQRAYAERNRISMNQARAVSTPGMGETKGAGGKESKADRLKRLMAAQFNSNITKDTKKTLERRVKEDGQSCAKLRPPVDDLRKTMRDRSRSPDARRARERPGPSHASSRPLSPHTIHRR